jgi:hypothetical protein
MLESFVKVTCDRCGVYRHLPKPNSGAMIQVIAEVEDWHLMPSRYQNGCNGKHLCDACKVQYDKIKAMHNAELDRFYEWNNEKIN